MPARANAEKFRTVLEKNTFYFVDHAFEDRYDAQIVGGLTNLLYNVQEKVRQFGIKKEFFDELLQHPNGLVALLTLNGFSIEQLKHLITIVRIVRDASLDQLMLREKWSKQDSDDSLIREWSTETIEKLALTDPFFRAGLVNLFFEGLSNPRLAAALPLFELRKLSIKKLDFQVDSMIDTLVRYKVKGSRTAIHENNPETVIGHLLSEMGISYESGDLSVLIRESFDQKRTMDFIIPDNQSPRLIVESSYLSTTSSGQGDKAKTEIQIRNLISKYYPQAQFIGFVDGIGWYVRQSDLERMVSAYDDVFTFHPDELERFRQILIKEFTR